MLRMSFLAKHGVSLFAIMAILLELTLVESFISTNNAVRRAHHRRHEARTDAQSTKRQPVTRLQQTIQNDNNNELNVSRKKFISTSIFSLLLSTQASNAQEQEEPKTITACRVVASGKPTNCVSTASVRQVDCYEPPMDDLKFRQRKPWPESRELSQPILP